MTRAHALGVNGIASVIETAEAVGSLHQHTEAGIVGWTICDTVLICVLVDRHGLAGREVLHFNAANDLLNGESLLARMITVQESCCNPYGIGSGEVDLNGGFHICDSIT